MNIDQGVALHLCEPGQTRVSCVPTGVSTLSAPDSMCTPSLLFMLWTVIKKIIFQLKKSLSACFLSEHVSGSVQFVHFWQSSFVYRTCPSSPLTGGFT